jgi:BlaI family transcriptional regulator, penicillinase repressor
MPRKKSQTLTEAELRVMAVLWDKGEATVREVTDALERKHDLAYTTILTVLRVLTEKKYVTAKADGRAHVFRPLVSREAARGGAVKQMLSSFFGGSTDALARHLIENESIDLDRLREIEAKLERKGKRRD